MKAGVVVSHGKLEVREVPMPEPGPFEALVKIEACGLCGTTDRHIVEGHMAHHPADWYPAILGHEGVGQVIEVGGKVKKFKPGDRVTRPTALWPGTHRDGLYSGWGGFAEYGLVRDTTGPGAPEPDFHTARQHVVPPALSVEDAVAAISLSEVASWMEKLGTLDGAGIVIGGNGFAACVMCQCAKAMGAKQIVVVGRSPKKMEKARLNGATHTVEFSDSARTAIREIIPPQGADWFLDAAGHQQVFEAGLSYLKPGGRAAIYGAPDGFFYRLPLGSVGGDFEVKMLFPNDDIFFHEACSRMMAGALDASKILTHVRRGLEALPSSPSDLNKSQGGGFWAVGLKVCGQTAQKHEEQFFDVFEPG